MKFDFSTKRKSFYIYSILGVLAFLISLISPVFVSFAKTVYSNDGFSYYSFDAVYGFTDEDYISLHDLVDFDSTYVTPNPHGVFDSEYNSLMADGYRETYDTGSRRFRPNYTCNLNNNSVEGYSGNVWDFYFPKKVSFGDGSVFDIRGCSFANFYVFFDNFSGDFFFSDSEILFGGNEFAYSASPIYWYHYYCEFNSNYTRYISSTYDITGSDGVYSVQFNSYQLGYSRYIYGPLYIYNNDYHTYGVGWQRPYSSLDVAIQDSIKNGTSLDKIDVNPFTNLKTVFGSYDKNGVELEDPDSVIDDSVENNSHNNYLLNADCLLYSSSFSNGNFKFDVIYPDWINSNRYGQYRMKLDYTIDFNVKCNSASADYYNFQDIFGYYGMNVADGYSSDTIFMFFNGSQTVSCSTFRNSYTIPLSNVLDLCVDDNGKNALYLFSSLDHPKSSTISEFFKVGSQLNNSYLNWSKFYEAGLDFQTCVIHLKWTLESTKDNTSKLWINKSGAYKADFDLLNGGERSLASNTITQNFKEWQGDSGTGTGSGGSSAAGGNASASVNYSGGSSGNAYAYGGNATASGGAGGAGGAGGSGGTASANVEEGALVSSADNSISEGAVQVVVNNTVPDSQNNNISGESSGDTNIDLDFYSVGNTFGAGKSLFENFSNSNNGFLQVLTATFSYIPSSIWEIITLAVGAVCVAALIGILFKVFF